MVYHVSRSSIDPKSKEDISMLQEQNQTLHPGLKIAKAKWIHRTYTKDKAHSTLILGLPTAQMADRVIQKGLTVNYTLHLGQYYSPEFRITQCFECCAYGHIASNCWKDEARGHCAMSHSTNLCKDKGTPKCANCNKPNAVWSNECTIREQAKAKARLLRHAAPQYYSNQAQRIDINAQSEQDWQQIGSCRRKFIIEGAPQKRAGPERPPAVQTGNVRSQSVILFAQKAAQEKKGAQHKDNADNTENAEMDTAWNE